MAAENSNFELAADNDIVEPRAGVETLPLGWYLISSSFTVTDYNYTPLKTVEGRYLKLRFKAVVDGENPLAVRIKIRDYDTKEFLDVDDAIFFMSNQSGDNTFTTAQFDLGYAGRKIQIYTQLESSYDISGESVIFTNYQSYVYN